MFALDESSAADFRREVARVASLPGARIAIECIHQSLADAIDLQKPRCDASGRCCRFEEFGHRLFITTVEMGVFSNELTNLPESNLTRWSGAGCPFQLAKQCGVHAVRPFGCRIFFCDPSADEWQSQQYERFHQQIKLLHEQLEISYFYVEWREALKAVRLI